MTDDIDLRLEETLLGLRHASPHVVGSAVVTADGFIVASALPDENYEKKVTVMAVGFEVRGQNTAPNRIGREDNGPGSVAEQDTGTPVFPVQNGGKSFNADNQGIVGGSGSNRIIGHG